MKPRSVVMVTAAAISAIGLFVGLREATLSLWSAQASGQSNVSVLTSHGSVSTNNQGGLFAAATGNTVDHLTLKNPVYPTPGPATAGTPYSCGAPGSEQACNAFTYDLASAWQMFIDAINANPTQTTFTLTNVIEISYDAIGANLGFDYDYQMVESAPTMVTPQDGTTVSPLWANSAKFLWVATTASGCLIAPPSGSEYVPNAHLSGTAIASSASLTANQSATNYLCMAQQYTPVQYTNTASAENGTYTHTATWTGVFYDNPSLTAPGTTMTPTIIVGVKAITP